MNDEAKPVLFFGGTFNPPHYGHSNLIHYVLEHMDFSRVYIIPSYHPPHKNEFDAVSFDDRLQMTRILFHGQNLPDNVEISDMERNLATPSYSWQTLEHLHKKHPHSKIYMLIGMDMYLNLHKWDNYEELIKNYNFIILKRKNLIAPKISSGDILLDNPYWNISSNEIRKLIVDHAKTLDTGIKRELETLISPQLLEYISQRGIYQS
jgi:nicotinate-nucleotide adenylyltransferase